MGGWNVGKKDKPDLQQPYLNIFEEFNFIPSRAIGREFYYFYGYTPKTADYIMQNDCADWFIYHRNILKGKGIINGIPIFSWARDIPLIVIKSNTHCYWDKEDFENYLVTKYNLVSWNRNVFYEGVFLISVNFVWTEVIK